MSALEDDCRRLLRWHSRKWRLAHGDIVVGMMMDRAAAEHRDALTPQERRAAAFEGVKERARFALPIAISAAAIATTVAGVVLTFIGATPGPALMLLAGPTLLILASIALLLSSGETSARALLIALMAGLAAVATIASLMGQTLAGREATSQAFWFVGSLYTGLFTLAVVSTLFRKVSGAVRPPALALALCILAGVVAAALFFVILFAAFPQLLAEIAVLTVSIIARNRHSKGIQSFNGPLQPAPES